MTIYHNQKQYDRDTLAALSALTNDQVEHLWVALFHPCPHGAFVKAAIEHEFVERFAHLAEWNANEE